LKSKRKKGKCRSKAPKKFDGVGKSGTQKKPKKRKRTTEKEKEIS